jgi:hypothetical protein
MSEPVSLQQAHLAHHGRFRPLAEQLDVATTWATSSSARWMQGDLSNVPPI